MASSESFVQFLVEQMEAAGYIRYRKMFGEYTLYCNEKVVALVCDEKLYVKATDAGRDFIGEVVEAPAYPGAKMSFLIEDKLEDSAWLSDLISITEKALPEPKPKKKKIKKMKTQIALFRGINVGGNSKLPMDLLREILSSLGAEGIETYIQSGNAVFKYEEGRAPELAQKIGGEVERRCGFRPAVLLLTREEFESAMTANPFKKAETEGSTLHLGFFASQPTKPNFEKLESLKAASERYHLGERVFYLHAPEGVGRSKLAAGLKRCWEWN